MAEEKKSSRAEGRYGKKEAKKPEHHEEKKPEKEHGEGEKKSGHHEKHAEERKAMAGKHHKEHRELHGQHRDAMASMHTRQEGEMKEMMDRHNEEAGAQGAPDGDHDQLPAEGAPAE